MPEDVDLSLFNPIYGWYGGDKSDDWEKQVMRSSNPNFTNTCQQKKGIPIDGDKLITGEAGDRVTESLNALWAKGDYE